MLLNYDNYFYYYENRFTVHDAERRRQ